MQRDEWGNEKRLEFGSGAYSQWIYKDQGLHVSQWSIGYTGGIHGGVRTYTYDSADRLTQAGEWNLDHDANGRLTSAQYTPMNATDPAFSTTDGYDAFGNNISQEASLDISSQAEIPSSLNNFAFDALPTNRLPATTKTGGMTGWSINLDGEAETIGPAAGAPALTTLTWDGLGRLSSASNAHANQTYLYDPSGYRVSVTDTLDATRDRKYVYTSGGLMLSEQMPSGAWRDIVYLDSVAVAEIDEQGIHELHADHLGTPRVITRGSDGLIEGRQSYSVFGEKISQTGYTPVTGFTGHVQTDTTDLIYMRGRYYSPAWHRFLSSDHGADAGSINQFAYAWGSPINHTDPSGFEVGWNCDLAGEGTWCKQWSWANGDGYSKLNHTNAKGETFSNLPKWTPDDIFKGNNNVPASVKKAFGIGDNSTSSPTYQSDGSDLSMTITTPVTANGVVEWINVELKTPQTQNSNDPSWWQLTVSNYKDVGIFPNIGSVAGQVVSASGAATGAAVAYQSGAYTSSASAVTTVFNFTGTAGATSAATASAVVIQAGEAAAYLSLFVGAYDAGAFLGSMGRATVIKVLGLK